MRSLFLLATVLFLGTFACSKSGHWQHFRWSAIEEARKRQMPIYLHFHDEKSELSRKQKEVLERLIKDPLFAQVGAYRVQWGAEPQLEKAFSVLSAPSLLVFRGDIEKARLGSDLNSESLRAALLKALE